MYCIRVEPGLKNLCMDRFCIRQRYQERFTFFISIYNKLGTILLISPLFLYFYLIEKCLLTVRSVPMKLSPCFFSTKGKGRMRGLVFPFQGKILILELYQSGQPLFSCGNSFVFDRRRGKFESSIFLLSPSKSTPRHKTNSILLESDSS